jgi:hypothetical protein
MTFFHFKLRLFLVQYRTNKSTCLPEVCACPVSRPRNRLVVQSCQDDARSSRLLPFNKFMGRLRRYFVQYFMQGSLSPLSHFDPSCHLFGGGERRVETRDQRPETRDQRPESQRPERAQDVSKPESRPHWLPRQHQSGTLSVPVPLLCWGAGSASSLNVLRLDLLVRCRLWLEKGKMMMPPPAISSSGSRLF